MAQNSCSILDIHKGNFTANLYTVTHFRMIGLIDVNIRYSYGVERVTLGFYSSSGTNNGKIKGLWYPIVGIKIRSGPFTEFTDYINSVLTRTTSHGSAHRGWLAKSLFFFNTSPSSSKLDGFSTGKYYAPLLKIGKTLRYWYDMGEFRNLQTLDPAYLNNALLSTSIYPGNTHSQRENYENFIHDIFHA